jgi:MOSC domain-containing protein YiiM
MSTENPHLKQILISPDKGQPMISQVNVRAISGQGLEGDRYAQGKGAWSKSREGETIRHVSLIESEAIEGSDFLPEDTRRNLITEGIDLNSLVGQTFQIGEVKLKGVELCEPCQRPSKLSGKSGFAEVFQNRGGLRAEILTEGELNVGDSIEVFSLE